METNYDITKDSVQPKFCRFLEKLQLPNDLPASKSLSDVRVNRDPIQDFCPLSSSLEWIISETVWATNGVGTFSSDNVPYVITNSGRASGNAAAVFYKHCLEMNSDQQIKVLELGAGTGLFCRFFLDTFRSICEQEKRDYYERLTYYVSDNSKRTVRQWADSGIFETHEGTTRLGVVNALRPQEFQEYQGDIIRLNELGAVFANYLLDVLPSAVLRMGSEGPEQLCVRTHLNTRSEQKNVDMDISTIRSIVESKDPADRSRLIPLLEFLEFETKFLPVPPGTIPGIEHALEFGRDLDRFTFNHGAITCLSNCVDLLTPTGFALINDYGPVSVSQVAEHASSQRFGPTSAQGVNFPLLEKELESKGLCVVEANNDHKRAIHSRLISTTRLVGVEETFVERFSVEADEFHETPGIQALDHVIAGRTEEALASYRIAIDRNPNDWHLIGRVAEFAALTLNEFGPALELATAALKLNPYYSSWLWNVLGDSLYCTGRIEDAHEAYRHALQIDPTDARAHLNIAYTKFDFGDRSEALQSIARGLSTDMDATYQQRLLEKQSQILGALSSQRLNESEQLLTRARAFAQPQSAKLI